MRNESRRIILGGDLNARIGQDYEQSQVSRGSGESFGVMETGFSNQQVRFM